MQIKTLKPLLILDVNHDAGEIIDLPDAHARRLTQEKAAVPYVAPTEPVKAKPAAAPGK